MAAPFRDVVRVVLPCSLDKVVEVDTSPHVALVSDQKTRGQVSVQFFEQYPVKIMALAVFPQLRIAVGADRVGCADMTPVLVHFEGDGSPLTTHGSPHPAPVSATMPVAPGVTLVKACQGTKPFGHANPQVRILGPVMNRV
jgi:hypothetical protein